MLNAGSITRNAVASEGFGCCLGPSLFGYSGIKKLLHKEFFKDLENKHK